MCTLKLEGSTKRTFARYKKPLKNHSLGVAKNVWKSIPHLMQ